MNKTYRGQTAIYAGMLAPAPLPGWARAARLHEWVQVPGNTLASINPENNPAVNPNHPAVSPWRGNTGQTSLVGAYSGAAYDDSTGFYWLPLQGGHGDYGGNEPYKIQMFSETPTWQMVRNPSGAVGNVINLIDGQDATGLYSDGRLRSVHSYSYNCAANGKVYAGGLTGLYPQTQAKEWAVEFNTTSGEYSLVCNYSGSATRLNNLYGASCIDPIRNAMYTAGRGTSRITKINLSSGVAAALTTLTGIFGEAGYMCATYAEVVDRVLFVAAQNPDTGYRAHRGLAVVNPANDTVVYPACDNFPSFIGQAPGAVWQPSQVRLLLWDNAAETNKVAVLTPSNSADLSQPWTASVITGTGVTPSARAAAGTYNRLQYSKRLGGLLLLNATNQQMYFMRTD